MMLVLLCACAYMLALGVLLFVMRRWLRFEVRR